ncbi:MAG: aromatic hydrocarbon degradation protein [Pseudomonas sp.]|nr:aromatic hydrocarbon degradation protein [Pseudomonas sp.]HBS77556.1 aromatic hydrocarbon degradation protein [Pseudomonas sp.]|tara:strand:- start:24709 stop:26079 length:1371 start_codon:yes stop_codon:yes gene_type:complete
MKATSYARISGSLLLLALCQPAGATDVLRLEGYGPISRSMGGTATAIDTGIAGIMSNPATLSLAPQGSRLSIGLDVVQPDISTRNLDTGETVRSEDASNNRGPYYAPQIGYSYRNDRWAFGIGAFAQGGLGTEYGHDSFLSAGSSGEPTGLDSGSRLLVLNIPLAFSFDITEQLTVGGSLDAMWMGMNLDMMFSTNQVGALIGNGRASGGLVPIIGGLPALDGAHISFSRDEPLSSGADAWGYGGRLGLLWKATPNTRVGLAYNVQSKMDDLKGDATVTAVDRLAGQVPLNGEISVRDFQMPAVLSAGVAHQVSDQWLITADVSRVFWRDVMEDINVTFVSDNGADLNLALPQAYRNQTIISVGTSYQIGHWTLRAGYRHGSKVIDGDMMFAALPVTPRRHGSLGLSYDLGYGSIDVAYDHAFEQTTYNRSLPNSPAPTRNSHSQDNLVIGYTHRF